MWQSHTFILMVCPTIIRPFNNFGPRQSSRAVIPTIIFQALKENEIKLKYKSRRDFLFVKDTVTGLLVQ